MPHAGVVQALARVTLFQLRQVQARAEVLALAVDHRRAHAGGQVVHHVAQRKDQAVVQRIALGGSGQADDRDFLAFAADFQGDVGGLRHGDGFDVEQIMVIKNNQNKAAEALFGRWFP
jgi:hypothetical protein